MAYPLLSCSIPHQHALPKFNGKIARDLDTCVFEIFDGYLLCLPIKCEFIILAGRYTAAGVTGAMFLEELQPPSHGTAPYRFCCSPDLSRETSEIFFHSQKSGWNYSSPASSSTLRATRKHSNPIGTPQ